MGRSQPLSRRRIRCSGAAGRPASAALQGLCVAETRFWRCRTASASWRCGQCKAARLMDAHWRHGRRRKSLYAADAQLVFDLKRSSFFLLSGFEIRPVSAICTLFCIVQKKQWRRIFLFTVIENIERDFYNCSKKSPLSLIHVSVLGLRSYW